MFMMLAITYYVSDVLEKRPLFHTINDSQYINEIYLNFEWNLAQIYLTPLRKLLI
jgi:hypothetical protein